MKDKHLKTALFTVAAIAILTAGSFLGARELHFRLDSKGIVLEATYKDKSPQNDGNISVQGNVSAGNGGTNGKGGDAIITGKNVIIGPGTYSAGSGGQNGNGGNIIFQAR